MTHHGRHTAMLLAAGLATRMRPLTNDTAKPLLTLGGRTLLDHALDHLVAAGVDDRRGQRVLAGRQGRRASGAPPAAAEHRRAAGDGAAGHRRRRARRAASSSAPTRSSSINGDAFWLNGPIAGAAPAGAAR